MANYYHVFPIGDIIKHNMDITVEGDSKCSCDPKKDLRVYDYNNSIIYVHEPLDGRPDFPISIKESIKKIVDEVHLNRNIDDGFTGKAG